MSASSVTNHWRPERGLRPGRGSAMISDGLFARFHCDKLCALHNNNQLPADRIGARNSAILSACYPASPKDGPPSAADAQKSAAAPAQRNSDVQLF